MKKAEYQQRGPIPQDVIGAVEFTLPAPAAGQVQVAVLAAPINPSDVLTLTGEYGLLPPLPAVGGNEGVGRVVAVGEGAEAFKIGQPVLLPPGCGSWSTHLNLAAKTLVPLPEGAAPQQLAMLTVNPPTAYLMLSEFVAQQPGDWIIQNAAKSAVGGYVTQLARLRGYKVVNVVRRESAVAAVKAEGAGIVLLDGEDLPARVRAATGEADIKLAIDCLGGVSTENLARGLALGGLLVNYGGMSGARGMN